MLDKIDKNFFFLATILLLIGVVLIANYIIGTEQIIDAAKHSFRGGMCGASFKSVCEKRYGFDFFILMFSFPIIACASSFLWRFFWQERLISSLFTSIIVASAWIALIELLVKLLKIPILYTHFMEGRQSLDYEFIGLIFGPNSIFFSIIAFLFFVILISGIVGYCLAGITQDLLKLRFNQSHL